MVALWSASDDALRRPPIYDGFAGPPAMTANEDLVRYPSGCTDTVGFHGVAYVHLGHVSRECARSGIEPGWRSLIDRLYDVLEPARARGAVVTVRQVKQKWGELRISLSGEHAAELRPLLIALRSQSRTTCERCSASSPQGPRDVLRGLAALPRIRVYCGDCYAAARIGEPGKTLRRIKDLLETAERQQRH